jgi:hypothetical protein
VGPDLVYRFYFHGPAYQVVDAAWREGDATAARLRPDLPVNHLPAEQPLFAGPRLIELCFQTAGLWEAAAQGLMALPLRVRTLRLLADPGQVEGPLHAVTRPTDDGVDALVVDGSGRVVLRLEGYATVPLPASLPQDLRDALSAALVADHD